MHILNIVYTFRVIYLYKQKKMILEQNLIFKELNKHKSENCNYNKDK